MKTYAIALAVLGFSVAGIGSASAAATSIAAAGMPEASLQQGLCPANDSESLEFGAPFLAEKLKEDHVKYDSISAKSNCFDVAVVGPNGRLTQQLYDPNTLTRIL